MERLPVTGIEIFLAIVREGSLRAAARSLGMGAPAVSYQLKALEQRLGVALMVRSTRSIELTEAGRTLLRGVEPAFRDLRDSIESSREAGRAKTGTLRLTLPRSALKICILPVLAEFQALYPDICLDFSINEGLADVVKEGFHGGHPAGRHRCPGYDRRTLDGTADAGLLRRARLSRSASGARSIRVTCCSTAASGPATSPPTASPIGSTWKMGR